MRIILSVAFILAGVLPLPAQMSLVDSLASAIAAGNWLTYDFDQGSRISQLDSIATSEQLMDLSNHENAVVRCCAFRELARRRHPACYKILRQRLFDTVTVNESGGCLAFRWRVGDYCLQSEAPLTPSQRTAIDSIIIFDDRIELDARAQILHRLVPDPRYHSRVRELARSNRGTIGALARYRHQDDIALLIRLLDDENTCDAVITAIPAFADEAFYQPLVRAYVKEMARKNLVHYRVGQLYEALTFYPRPETVMLFEKTSGIDDFIRRRTQERYMVWAIWKRPSPIFQPLVARIDTCDIRRR